MQKKVNKKRLFYAIGFILILVFIAKPVKVFILNAIEDPYNIQKIGNYLYSDKDIDLDSLHCHCDSLQINIGEKPLLSIYEIIDSLHSPLNRLKRYLHFANLVEIDPYSNEIPSTDYSDITYSFNQFKAEGKLKMIGRYWDHYNTDKFSFRIKSKKNFFINDKTNFYHSQVRYGGVYEWFGNEILKLFDIISLDCGFVDVTINGEHKNLYFYQEQPTSNTIEKNHRKPGITFRISKDSSKNLYVSNLYDFDKENDSNYLKLLNVKLEKYNQQQLLPKKLFNIQKMIDFGTAMSFLNADHARYPMNTYFYFNPTDSLVEPFSREFQSNSYEPKGSISFSHPYYLKKTYFKPENIGRISDTYCFPPKEAKQFKSKVKENLRLKISERFFEEMEAISDNMENIMSCGLLSDPSYSSFDFDRFLMNKELIIQYFKKNTSK